MEKLYVCILVIFLVEILVKNYYLFVRLWVSKVWMILVYGFWVNFVEVEWGRDEWFLLSFIYIVYFLVDFVLIVSY